VSTRRAHIVIPEPLVSEIDRLVGKRGRSEFLALLKRNFGVFSKSGHWKAWLGPGRIK